MNFSVRNLFVVLALIASVEQSCAEDWSGTYWEGVQKGACYPSVKAFKKNQYSIDKEISVTESKKTSKEKYFWVNDLISRSALVYHNEKNGSVCLIAYLSGGGGEDYSANYSADGAIIELKSSEYTYPMYPNAPHTREIIYRPDKQGRFFPSECTLLGENNYKRQYDCIKGDVQSVPVRVPPSFDCSNPRKLNRPEYLICSNGNFTELDIVLDKNYKTFQSANIGELRSKLIRDQRAWIKRRNECKGDWESIWECVDASYRERITEICTKYPVVSGPAPVCISAPEKPDLNTVIQ
jgi:uncharacterized protein YecT (DUF1311 family)